MKSASENVQAFGLAFIDIQDQLNGDQASLLSRYLDHILAQVQGLESCVEMVDRVHADELSSLFPREE